MKVIRGILTTLLILGGLWGILALIAWVSGAIPEPSPSAQSPWTEVPAGETPPNWPFPIPPPPGGFPFENPGAPPGTGAPSSSSAAPDIEAASRAAGGYMETLCDDDTSLEDLAADYDPENLRPSLEALAERRYPFALPFVRAQDQRALRTWTRDPSSFASAANSFEVVAHEGSHIYGATRMQLRSYTYRVRDDLEIQTRRLQNFPRSEIVRLHVDRDADRYVSTYLEGASGAQGFNTLLDEYNAYVHGLAARWCTRDLIPSTQRVSSRAGPLTMMYWVSLYLRLAREEHPDDYAAILADPAHIQLILTVWDRARFWLAITESANQLTYGAEGPERWATAPETVAEIERLRAAE